MFCCILCTIRPNTLANQAGSNLLYVRVKILSTGTEKESKIDGVMTVEEEARAHSTQDQAAPCIPNILPKLLLAGGTK